MESNHSHHSDFGNLSTLLHSLVDRQLTEPALRELLRTWDVPMCHPQGDRTSTRV